MSSSSWVHLDVDVKATDAALLCRISGEDVWLPRSQVSEGDKYEEGDCHLTLSVTERIAREKGLES